MNKLKRYRLRLIKIRHYWTLRKDAFNEQHTNSFKIDNQGVYGLWYYLIIEWILTILITALLFSERRYEFVLHLLHRD